ncbi:acetolactate synthase-1/2/3 large subunit [Amorphus suaedae]
MNKMTQTATQASGAEIFLSALSARGVDYVFGNAGTDFAPIIEAFSNAAASGRTMPMPVTVPHENVAICMAQGVYLTTGRPQAVILHVNVGTANAICGLINASRERTPVFLAAGRTPVLEEGMTGARNAFIHWGQEMFDQGAMVREFVKWDYELRYPEHAASAVDRALAISMSEPKGPIYMTLPREVLSAHATGPVPTPATPPSPAPAPNAEALAEAAELLSAAKRPLLVCASLGKTADEVAALTALAEAQGIGVVAYRPRYMALPSAHPSHLGYDVTPHIGDADLVIVAECDVPWIPSHHTLADDAKVLHLGVDPLFSRYPMRTFPVTASVAGDAVSILQALATAPAADDVLAGRRSWLEAKQEKKRAALAANPPKGGAGPSSNAWLAKCLADVQRPTDAFVLETPFPIVHMSFSEPGTYFSTPSAGGLGWGLGASLGVKLGSPERRVIAVVGDGSYMFGNPTPAHMMARSMEIPTLTVIINNGMWAAVRRATLGVYPDGAAAQSNHAPLTYLEPTPDYEKVVEASGGYGEKVEHADDLPAALARALHAVEHEGRPAVLNVLTEYSDDQAKRDART